MRSPSATSLLLMLLVLVRDGSSVQQMLRRPALKIPPKCRCCASPHPLLLANEGSTNSGKVSEGSVAALKLYKQFISPLIPPGCRFIPTCSEYGQLAYKQYPPLQATVLTAWRLVRCNPLHLKGCGYGDDVPQWPPPAYWAGSARIRTFLDDEESRRRAEMGDDDDQTPLAMDGDPLGIYSADDRNQQ